MLLEVRSTATSMDVMADIMCEVINCGRWQLCGRIFVLWTRVLLSLVGRVASVTESGFVLEPENSTVDEGEAQVQIGRMIPLLQVHLLFTSQYYLYSSSQCGWTVKNWNCVTSANCKCDYFL